MPSFSKPENESKYSKNYAAHKPGIKNDEVVNYYNEWAQNYDNDLDSSVYRGPEIAASLCNIFVMNKNSRVIDIGAGTGFCGQYLKKYGFNQVDALDPSESMLMVAKEKNVYNKLFFEGINANKKTSIETGYYDACVMSGAFGEGHIPCEGIRELARIVKSNGHIILVMRKEYLNYVEDYVDKLEPLMDRMVKENIWIKSFCFEIENYSFDKNGLAFVLKKI